MAHKNDQRFNDADYAFKYDPKNRATAGKNFSKVSEKTTTKSPYFKDK